MEMEAGENLFCFQRGFKYGTEKNFMDYCCNRIFLGSSFCNGVYSLFTVYEPFKRQPARRVQSDIRMDFF